ncbi:MAG TPA: diaminopimelate epimerase [Alphaproteobacteria bacterium]|nr:diaminopimelate epimerase [Alphaproteobacteria bacterium]|tara:strand:+ start:1382 stop:2230 length:849 start_codon:yes stop_codon:yes gene_type:complete
MSAFAKMHGLGNDFVILDWRNDPDRRVPAAAAQRLADRRLGIGCDQILVIRPSQEADIRMDILNQDGSPSGACGNGTRCVADLVMAETGADRISIVTDGGMLSAWRAADDQISVDMGPVFTGWQDVPLAESMDTLHVPLGVAGLPDAVCHALGNPHAVVFVEDAEGLDLARLGPQVEQSSLFPDRVNLSVLSRRDDGSFRMRVWERGVGITMACGSGACASGVAIARRGLGGDVNKIVMDGGAVTIAWQRDNGHVVMTGPVAYVASGYLSPEISALLEADDG